MARADYGERYMELIKEHPDWKPKQYAEALSMPWDANTQNKLWSFRKIHAAQIAEMLGESVDAETSEECEKARAQLLAMTDEERQEYKNQCKGYDLRRAKEEKERMFKRIADLEGENERLENALTESNDAIARLEAEMAADKALLRDFEKANAELKDKSQGLTEVEELKIYIAEMVLAGWRERR